MRPNPLPAWPSPSAPEPGGVRLWLQDLDGPRARGDEERAATILSADELLRSERLKDPVARRRFVARCVFVRTTLGRLMAVPPALLEFGVEDMGKPRLRPAPGRPEAPRFSVAHAANVLALAVSPDRELGVDVELVDQRFDPYALAALVLPPADARRVAAASPADAHREFLQAWTRFEALAKADGRGIAAPPDRHAGRRWTLRRFHRRLGATEVVGAIAVARDAGAGGIRAGWDAPGRRRSGAASRRP